MLVRTPDYYEKFSCLAGACPRSCCIGWEVEVDGDSAACYRALPGPLGERLRAALRRDAEGGECFALTEEGRCPFLNEKNLCDIHTALGPERTSAVCRSHPRFIEEYGSLREITLCASCPEASRLLLAVETPLAFAEKRTEEPEEAPDAWLAPLLESRRWAFAMLQDRTRPLAARLTELLVFAAGAQSLLDAERAEELPGFCRTWHMAETMAPSAGAEVFPQGWALLRGLEILGDDWRGLLQKADTLAPRNCPDWALERIAAYFLFRYYLKSINDGDLLGRVELTVFSVLALDRLSGAVGLPAALEAYCREIEHCAENLDALLWAFRSNSLSMASLLRTTGKIC